MIRTSAINLVLKIGLAITSVSFAFLSFTKAAEVIIYYPDFIVSLFGEITTLSLGAATAIVMAIWLLSRKHKFAAAFTYSILLLVAIFFNLDSIRFLSVAWPLICMSLALALRYYPRIRIIIPGKNGDEKMKIVPAAPDDDAEEAPATSGEVSSTEALSDNEDNQDNENKSKNGGDNDRLYGKEEIFEENKKDNDVSYRYSTLDDKPRITADLLDNMDDESVPYAPVVREIEDMRPVTYHIAEEIPEEFKSPVYYGDPSPLPRKKVSKIRITPKNHLKDKANKKRLGL